jgi:hypothetical protein
VSPILVIYGILSVGQCVVQVDLELISVVQRWF